MFFYYSVIVNCYFFTVKNYFIFFLSHKILSKFKFNNFKCIHLNNHSHFNTFKIINSFCQFLMRMDKMIAVNKWVNIYVIDILMKYHIIEKLIGQK